MTHLQAFLIVFLPMAGLVSIIITATIVDAWLDPETTIDNIVTDWENAGRP